MREAHSQEQEVESGLVRTLFIDHHVLEHRGLVLFATQAMHAVPLELQGGGHVAR